MKFEDANTIKVKNFLGLDGKTIKSAELLVYPGASLTFPITLITLEDGTRYYFQYIDEEKMNDKLQELRSQFHKLWTKDTASDKQEWQYFASILKELGLPV